MGDFIRLVYEWINAHPEWAQLLLFLTAMLDALFIVGAFVPAGIVLFAVGALIALGSIDLWTTVLIAAAGALSGDAISFWIGRHYRERLYEWRLLKRYPDAVRNAQRFFERHGGKGVMLARFLGPVRSVTPAMAGAAGMSVGFFVVADGVAALAWSLAYILPGVVFGASLGLAAEVAGRLALVLLFSVTLVWMLLSLTLFTIRTLQNHAEQWIGAALDWSRRHRGLGNFGAALADPDYPETPVLAILAAVLLLLGGLWLYLWAAPGLHPYPSSIDAAVFQSFRELYTPWGIAAAEVLLQLGEWQVYGPVALTGFVSLVLARRPRAAAHWVAALAFAGLISLGLYMIPQLPPPHRYFGTLGPTGYTDRDLMLPIVIYSFMPVLLATKRRTNASMLFYSFSLLVLLFIVLARLYLGAQWWSMAMFSLVMGLLWTGMLGLGYRRHHPERLSATRFMLPVVAVFVLAASLQWSSDRVMTQHPETEAPVASLPAAAWAEQAYQLLPAQRHDVAGRPKQEFNLQWAGNLPEIEQALRRSGWQDVTPATAADSLRWLTSKTPIAELPVLPQVHARNHQSLMLRLPIDDQRQYLLRLWPSGYRLDDGQPLWVGYIASQRALTSYRLLRYPVSDAAPPRLQTLLGSLPESQVVGTGAVWRLRTRTSLGESDD
jgi:membrane protein DedA with SNARE-associated domain